MTRWRVICSALFVLALTTPVLLAHHSVTKEFDQTKSTYIYGVIKKVEWMNPHSWITLESKDAKGMATTWRVEIASATGLIKRGIRADLEFAKPCSIEIWPARDGTKTAYGRQLTYANGKRLDIHASLFDPLPLSAPAK